MASWKNRLSVGGLANGNYLTETSLLCRASNGRPYLGLNMEIGLWPATTVGLAVDPATPCQDYEELSFIRDSIGNTAFMDPERKPSKSSVT